LKLVDSRTNQLLVEWRHQEDPVAAWGLGYYCLELVGYDLRKTKAAVAQSMKGHREEPVYLGWRPIQLPAEMTHHGKAVRLLLVALEEIVARPIAGWGFAG
jgi:hypothetical protein